MDRRIIWSKEAVSDIRTLAEFIAKDSPYYSSSFVREIRDASRSLSKFSERGRNVPELDDPAIRELLIKDYRMIYSIEKSRVIILGFVHCRRDLKNLWKDK